MSDRVVVRFDKRIVERNAFVTKSEEDNNAIPLKVMLGTDRAFREQEDDEEGFLGNIDRVDSSDRHSALDNCNKVRVSTYTLAQELLSLLYFIYNIIILLLYYLPSTQRMDIVHWHPTYKMCYIT